jgi:signal peptidase I
MSYELILTFVFLVGLMLQFHVIYHPSGTGVLGSLGKDLDKSGRSLCFVGVIGLAVLLLGVEIFLAVFTVLACVIAYVYRFAYPAQLQRILGEDGFVADVVSFCSEYATFLLIIFLIRNFCVQHYRVPTGSLEPTVRPGDFLLVNQFSYGWHVPVVNTKIANYGTPQRGDIALFRYPKDPYRVIYVKRVVGLPGDHIVYRNKQLMINGELVPQEYLGMEQEFGSGYKEMLAKRKEYLPGKTHDIYVRNGMSRDLEVDLVVPEGSYFMMGDNRDNSMDSRYFGPVDEKFLLGRVMLILISWDGWRPAWDRMGVML